MLPKIKTSRNYTVDLRVSRGVAPRGQRLTVTSNAALRDTWCATMLCRAPTPSQGFSRAGVFFSVIITSQWMGAAHHFMSNILERRTRRWIFLDAFVAHWSAAICSLATFWYVVRVSLETIAFNCRKDLWQRQSPHWWRSEIPTRCSVAQLRYSMDFVADLQVSIETEWNHAQIIWFGWCSPELNPAELIFAEVKNYLRYRRNHNNTFFDEIENGFKHVSLTNIHSYFDHCLTQ